MTTIREAAQQALEALEFLSLDFFMLDPISPGREAGTKAITALRAALAEPVQEPVAWAVYDIKHGGSKTLHWPEQHSPNGDPSQFKAVPLYSAPPQLKPVQEERNFCPRCGKRSFPDTIHTCTPPQYGKSHD